MADGDIKKGTMKRFTDNKGLAHIITDNGSKDLVMHRSATIKYGGFRSVGNGVAVEYIVEYGKDGRAKAANVTGPERDPLQNLLQLETGSVLDESKERGCRSEAEDMISKSLSSYVASGDPSKCSNLGGSKNCLPEYPIPLELRDMINNHEIPKAVSEGLTMENYGSFFNTLLAMEEIKLEDDIRSYGMENVTMKSKGQIFLSLQVPGLAEKRPSLARGDFIFVKLTTDGEEYQGYINQVEAEELILKFNEKFHLRHRDSNLYNVQFTYNRSNMRQLYQAVEAAASLGTDLLFPSAMIRMRHEHPKVSAPICYDLNLEQQRAVDMIYVSVGGPPYVIHGPPGTGKTKTLIKAILQVYCGNRNARILACAPSNIAADNILDRLISETSVQLQKHDIFRLNAFTRPFDDVDPDHLEFCYHEDRVFVCPPCSTLARYRIVVSTYMSASILHSEGIQRSHFSYIFLDEAGHASEPETMVPIAHLHSKSTVLVLAGDPMQLGPVVLSGEAKVHGLGTSFLERLLGCELYQKEDDAFMTTLVRNYRTHEVILALPADLFYSGRLFSFKEDYKDSSSWEGIIPDKEFPLFFIGIEGLDEREENNPSWFNRFEASKTVKIINVLIQEKGLKEEEIGVIAPYRKQVSKIKETLDRHGSPNVKVGSVEQFQGQEREVIIISTVCSTIKHEDFDETHYLGPLSNPGMFNVAITRGKSLIIVIGNPHIICKDRNWNEVLSCCVDYGSYDGCPLPKQFTGYRGENSPPCESNWSDDTDEWQPPPLDEYGWDQPCESNWSDDTDEWQPPLDEYGWDQQGGIPLVDEDN